MKRLAMAACLICLCFCISCEDPLSFLDISEKIHPDQGVYYWSIDNVFFSYTPATYVFTAYNPSSIPVAVNVKRYDAYTDQRAGITVGLHAGQTRAFADVYGYGDEIQVTVYRDRLTSVCYLKFC